MELLTVTNAKPQLGHLVDLACDFVPVFIRRGSRIVQLVPATLPDPIPVYPFGALSRSDAEISQLQVTATEDESAPLSL